MFSCIQGSLFEWVGIRHHPPIDASPQRGGWRHMGLSWIGWWLDARARGTRHFARALRLGSGQGLLFDSLLLKERRFLLVLIVWCDHPHDFGGQRRRPFFAEIGNEWGERPQEHPAKKEIHRRWREKSCAAECRNEGEMSPGGQRREDPGPDPCNHHAEVRNDRVAQQRPSQGKPDPRLVPALPTIPESALCTCFATPGPPTGSASAISVKAESFNRSLATPGPPTLEECNDALCSDLVSIAHSRGASNLPVENAFFLSLSVESVFTKIQEQVIQRYISPENSSSKVHPQANPQRNRLFLSGGLLFLFLFRLAVVIQIDVVAF